MPVKRTKLIGVHVYVGVTFFCLMASLLPYILSKDLHSQKVLEVLIYDFQLLPVTMIFSLAIPLLLAIAAASILILYLLKTISDRQYLFVCIGLIASMSVALLAGYVLSEKFYWLFIAIFPMIGAIMSFEFWKD